MTLDELLLRTAKYPMLALGDLPHGPVAKNPLCSAGDPSSIPGGGTKISHMPWTN